MPRKPADKSKTPKKQTPIPPQVSSTSSPKESSVQQRATQPVGSQPIATQPVVKQPSATQPTAPQASQAIPNDLLQKMLAALDSKSAATRALAVTEIGRTGDRAAVPALIRMLQDPDADVACDAAIALGQLGDVSSVESLIEVINNSSGYFHSVVRAAAAHSLAQLKDKRAVDALIAAIRDPMAEASAEAVRALAALGDIRAVGPLVEVLENSSGYFLQTVRLAAVIALGRLGGQQAKSALTAVASAAWEDLVLREAAEKAAV